MFAFSWHEIDSIRNASEMEQRKTRKSRNVFNVFCHWFMFNLCINLYQTRAWKIYNLYFEMYSSRFRLSSATFLRKTSNCISPYYVKPFLFIYTKSCLCIRDIFVFYFYTLSSRFKGTTASVASRQQEQREEFFFFTDFVEVSTERIKGKSFVW